MNRPKKDHRRMMFDTRRIMKATSYHTVLFCALAHDLSDRDEIKLAEQEACVLLEKFNDTGIVPDFVEAFCLDVLLGHIPIFNSKGKRIN